MTRESVFTSMRRHCEGRNMVALTFLGHADFNTPYAYCREEMAYVCRLHDLIRACKADKLQKMDRFPSLFWLLFNRNPHLVALHHLFNPNNNLCLRVRAKSTAYITRTDFTVYFGLTDAERDAQWLFPAMIVQGAEVVKLWNSAFSPATAYLSQRAKRDKTFPLSSAS